MPILNPTIYPFPANYPGPFYTGSFPQPWPPGTKPIQQSPFNNFTFRFLLRQYLVSGAVIGEVFISPTNTPGEPDLTNVRVVSLSQDSVTFAPAGSPTTGLVTIRLENVIGIEAV